MVTHLNLLSAKLSNALQRIVLQVPGILARTLEITYSWSGITSGLRYQPFIRVKCSTRALLAKSVSKAVLRDLAL